MSYRVQWSTSIEGSYMPQHKTAWPVKAYIEFVNFMLM